MQQVKWWNQQGGTIEEISVTEYCKFKNERMGWENKSLHSSCYNSNTTTIITDFDTSNLNMFCYINCVIK